MVAKFTVEIDTTYGQITVRGPNGPIPIFVEDYERQELAAAMSEAADAITNWMEC